MECNSIPQFHATLYLMFRGFDPLLTAWEEIELPQLNELETFLTDAIVPFQDLTLIDKQHGYPAASFVIKVRRIFDTFLLWSETLPQELLDPATEGDKENSLRNICMLLSFLWIPWMETDYEPLAKQAQLVPKVMPIDEVREIAKKNRQEKELDTMRSKLFSVIVGSTPAERERIFDNLKSLVKGKGGKELALYIRAAINLGILTRIPPFECMKKFWGVTMSQQSLSRFINKTDSALDEKDVESKQHEIEYLQAVNV